MRQEALSLEEVGFPSTWRSPVENIQGSGAHASIGEGSLSVLRTSIPLIHSLSYYREDHGENAQQPHLRKQAPNITAAMEPGSILVALEASDV